MLPFIYRTEPALQSIRLARESVFIGFSSRRILWLLNSCHVRYCVSNAAFRLTRFRSRCVNPLPGPSHSRGLNLQLGKQKFHALVACSLYSHGHSVCRY